jgi:urocanate hydratase
MSRPSGNITESRTCVLTTDPGMGIIRHAAAGYEEAIEFAEKNEVKIPMKNIQ